MSESEFGDWVEQLPRGDRRRSVDALNRLGEAARRSVDARRFVVLLLDEIADAAESHAAPGDLSEPERRLWEAMGAGFSDANATARSDVRAATAFVELLGRCLHGDAAVAERLGVDRSRVSQRLGERSLYVIEAADERHYPVWQFSGGSVLRGLRAVLQSLDRELHPLVVDHWMTAPNVDLEIGDVAASPVEWLTTGGEPKRVAALAVDV